MPIFLILIAFLLNSAWAQHDFRSHDIDEIIENCPPPSLHPSQEVEACNLNIAFSSTRSLDLYQRTATLETRREIDALQNNEQLSNGLRTSLEWTQNVLRQPALVEEFENNNCLRQILQNPRTNLIRVLYKVPSGVNEGYTVGEHSGRVLETFLERRRSLGNVAQNDIPAADFEFFKKVLLLHDIGKGFSALLRRHQLEEEFSAPLVYRIFLLLGYPEAKAQLARELIRYHKLLGSVTQSRMGLDSALDSLQDGARQAHVSVIEFYRYLENLYIADAASYPRVRERAFEVVEDGLFPTSASFFSFRQMVFTPGNAAPRVVVETQAECPRPQNTVVPPRVVPVAPSPSPSPTRTHPVIAPVVRPAPQPRTPTVSTSQSRWYQFTGWFETQWSRLVRAWP